jgi:hypothetical protein
MHKAVIRGSEAKIIWGYHKAASLGPWTLTAEGANTTVTAKVVTQDECAVSQRPLSFVVVRPKGQKWVWPVETVVVSGDTITLSVGQPQE